MSILASQSSCWGGRELVALLSLSFWCLLMVECLFLAVPSVCLRFVIGVFPDHNHLLFFIFCTIPTVLIMKYNYYMYFKHVFC